MSRMMMTTRLSFHSDYLVILHLAIFCLYFVIVLFMKEAVHLLLVLNSFFTHSTCFVFLH
jgi:hypothetical protein